MRILDPVIAAVQDKVRIDPVAEHSAAVAPTCGARVSITTTDGRTATSTLQAPCGSSERGIAWSDLDRKYRTLLDLAGVDGPTIDASLSLTHRLKELEDVTELTAALSM